MTKRHIVFEIEVPAVYTDDLDALREHWPEPTPPGSDAESDFLLNCIGEPSVCRVRTEFSGEKDSDVVEVWGLIRRVRLAEPSRGYSSAESHLTDEQLVDHGWRLMRDEGACEWCRLEEGA